MAEPIKLKARAKLVDVEMYRSKSWKGTNKEVELGFQLLK